MLVSWAAGGAILGKGPHTPAWSSDAVHAIVQYGLDPEDLSMTVNGTDNNLVRLDPFVMSYGMAHCPFRFDGHTKSLSDIAWYELLSRHVTCHASIDHVIMSA